MVRDVSLGDAVDGKTIGIDGNVWLYKAARPYASDLAAAYKTTDDGDKIVEKDNPLLKKVHNKIADHLRKWVKDLMVSCGAWSVVVVFDGTTVNLVLKEKTREQRRQARAEALQRARACKAGSAEALQLFYDAFDVTQELIDTCLSRFVGFSKWNDYDESSSCGKAFALQAPEEADAQLARLFREEMIDLVCSEDCDLIALGVPLVLREVKMYERTAKLFEFDPDKASPELTKVLGAFQPPDVQKVTGGRFQMCRCGSCYQDICRTVLRDMHILMGTDYDEAHVRGVGEKRVCEFYVRACERNKAREGYCFCGLSIQNNKCGRALPCSADLLAAAADLNLKIDRPSRWARAFDAERNIFLHAVVWEDPTATAVDRNRKGNNISTSGSARRAKAKIKPLCPIPHCCANPTDEDENLPKENHNCPSVEDSDFDEDDFVDSILKFCFAGFIACIISNHNGCRYVPEEVNHNRTNPMYDTIKPLMLSFFDGDSEKVAAFFSWVGADEDRRIEMMRPFFKTEDVEEDDQKREIMRSLLLLYAQFVASAVTSGPSESVTKNLEAGRASDEITDGPASKSRRLG
eukprot:g9542.t1